MDELQKEIVKWHKETFPNATKKAIEDKLAEECGELTSAAFFLTDDHVADEGADVVIVLCSLLDRMNLSLETIVRRKLEINKKRTWGKETSNGDRPRVK